MTPILLAAAAAAAVFLLVRGFVGGGRTSTGSRRRMDAVLNSAADADARRAKSSRRSAVGAMGKKRISALKSQRRNANYKALSIAGLCGIVTAVVGWTFLGIVGSIAGMGAGFLLPTVVRSQMTRQRRSKINDQLPDLLQTLAGGLRAGQTFIQTLDSAADELGEPFRTELLRALRELELGVSVEDAFEGLRDRIQDDDFDLVVDAVLIQRKVGGNLAEVLTNIAHTIRERIRIRGEVNALTGQARLSGWVLGLLPVAVAGLVYAMDPEYMTPMFTNPFGLMAIIGAGVSEVFGMLVIRKIADVKV